MGGSSELRVRTSRKIERLDVTKRIEKALEELGGEDGAALISTPHTTAAIVVGEAWDPDVTGDMERALHAWVPDVHFEHGEGNSPAHFLSEAIGNARLVPLSRGKLVLGRWQGIFLIELDGPRERTVRVAVLGS
jgi:secondary thiamine-phosphate synthase enzyme